jgi:hypothetical protein
MVQKFNYLVDVCMYYSNKLVAYYHNDTDVVRHLNYSITKLKMIDKSLFETYDEKLDKRLDRYVNYFKLLDEEQMYNYLTELPVQLLLYFE